MPTLTVTSLLLAAVACHAQDPGAQAKPGAKEVLLRTFAEAGLQVDLEHKSVTVPTRMGRPGDLIEYLLIHKRGKSHESMFVMEAKPSVLNAALLALGLEPGINVSYKEKDPPPSDEEIRAGVDWLIVTPPKGRQVWFTARWKDADGKEQEAPIEDLMLDVMTGEAMEGAEWIFLGGRMAAPYRGEPPVYIADLEGNLVSTFYVEPQNHLVTLRHERARSDQNWWITDRCPPPGTEVAFTVHVEKPKLVAEREARLAKEKAEGKQPKGPVKDLPVGPAGAEGAPPIKRDK